MPDAPLGLHLQIRLDTLMRLYAIKWLCFMFLETDHYLRAPGHGCALLRAGKHARGWRPRCAADVCACTRNTAAWL